MLFLAEAVHIFAQRRCSRVGESMCLVQGGAVFCSGGIKVGYRLISYDRVPFILSATRVKSFSTRLWQILVFSRFISDLVRNIHIPQDY